ncbi:hypothetical protein BSL78_25447 [Apostichopus japonicus]|uniref:Uncharacterized protein n=1 Tax=Stichopus japonicus TaxID=307972 RepID=A0A2G8JPL4_STIJA|nr:hypothetical protein BSL78_25447 [Apostichopus japonicus]
MKQGVQRSIVTNAGFCVRDAMFSPGTQSLQIAARELPEPKNDIVAEPNNNAAGSNNCITAEQCSRVKQLHRCRAMQQGQTMASQQNKAAGLNNGITTEQCSRSKQWHHNRTMQQVQTMASMQNQTTMQQVQTMASETAQKVLLSSFSESNNRYGRDVPTLGRTKNYCPALS